MWSQGVLPSVKGASGAVQMKRANRSIHLSWSCGLLLLSAYGAAGCEGGFEGGNSGGSSMGGSTKGGAGGASGSATGGSSGATSGASTGGSVTGGTAGSGGASNGGTGGSSGAAGGRGGMGGSAGSTPTLVGGCPDPTVCPDMPENGQSCSAAMTCCTYQMLGADVVGCLCTDGVWDCRGTACGCI
jgi:hypothetical protein